MKLEKENRSDATSPMRPVSEQPLDEPTTTCCIVGAGPAGVMLAWLLARQGIAVTLLERHGDFDRDFRGDTLHPGILEILDQVGLAEKVLALPHARMQELTFHTASGSLRIADLRRLKTRFPFVAMLPQSSFLDRIVSDAQRFKSFRLVLRADVRQLLEQDGVVRGVRYVDNDGHTHQVTSTLVVAADGRNSRLRRAAGLTATRSAPEIDVLWFRMPRHEGQLGGGYLASGAYMIVLDRQNQWQVGFVIPKGRYPQIRQAGLESFRESVARLAPALAASAEHLTDWAQVRLLSVQADRLRTWYRPGLLLLGDAAHVMSPVGGVGINYAIQDAVEAANLLTGPLQAGSVRPRDLRAVQQRRLWPTRVVQALQSFDQRYLIQAALDAREPYRLPLWFRLLFRLPIIRHLPSRLMAFGTRRVRIRKALL
jgi:2-polyprenyl-6-methoxyphenol hydroxylase-like FAD-dependent oxidoreductase